MGRSSDLAMNDEFDLWLTDELGRGYATFRAVPPPAGAPYRAASATRGARGRAARAALVVLAVAIGLMATTVLAAAAVTGSANPQAWGQYVSDAVSTCKSELANGQHGIGQCVQAIARQKGPGEETSTQTPTARAPATRIRPPKADPVVYQADPRATGLNNRPVFGSRIRAWCRLLPIVSYALFLGVGMVIVQA